MQLSFRDKQKINQPVTVLANWFDPNNAASHGNTQFSLETTVEVDEGVSIYTLSISAYITTKFTAKEEQLIQVRDVTGKKLINAAASKKIDDFALKLIGQYTIAIDRNDDSYKITKEEWEQVAATPLTDKRGRAALVSSLTYESDYKDVVIKSHQDVFNTLVDLNNKSIYKNPTISLLLRLIEYGDSNYSVVFLEWFEEQFLNDDVKHRQAFGNTFLQEYQELKKKEEAEESALEEQADVEANEFVILEAGDPEISN